MVDVCELPEFASIIEGWLWRTLLEPKGYALAFTEKQVPQNLNDGLVPLAIVAYDGCVFMRTDYLNSKAHIPQPYIAT